MFFNSIEFLLFLPTVFCLYWFVFQKNLRTQNLLLLISSYVFYGWWDWRFLSLILLSTVVDYFVGLKIYDSRNKKTKKHYLWISILFNLGLLGFFKYFNFFIDSWIDFLGAFGYQDQSTWTLKVILPVGISFYTFQTMSYSLDIYFKKLKPTKDFISFASFVSFFPQLVAGPIEKARDLLPQFSIIRKFDHSNAVNGLRQIFWGFVKKTLIADQCSETVNLIFSNYNNYQGSTLLLGAVFFSIQIYGDFSGYSDIAIGTARLFGFRLRKNFSYPYFSKSMAEFWRKWHISLSSWFKDYVFIPLGGSYHGKIFTIRNIFVTFLVSGLWHGANWTFIFWGGLNAFLLLPSIIRKERILKNLQVKKLLFINNILSIIRTFTLVTLGWVFFRSESLKDSFNYLKNIFSKSFFTKPEILPKITIIFILIFILIEWFGKNDKYVFSKIIYLKKRYRWIIYLILCFLIFILSSDKTEFIYFQF
jgi:alginate O-acetyltransferase complex protein AlgI